MGKKEKFEAFYREYRDRLYSVAFRMVGNKEDGIDIVQESFVKAYQKWDSFREEAKFYTWIYRIVINLSYDYIRKRKREKIGEIQENILKSEKIESDKMVILRDIKDEIQKEIENLTPRQKSIFILKTYEELPYKQIAEILKSREGTVKATYFQSVEKIRKNLKEKGVLKNVMQEI
ncbi:MAG TPA: RNA polymerase sigma factor [bacterium]|nr:RNA polymerase sigma factor [bacterium]